MFQYILEVNICWFFFYVFYKLVISKGTYFHVQRWYLLSILVLGLILPLFHFITFKSATSLAQSHGYLPIFIVRHVSESIVNAGSSNILLFWIWLAYWIGVAFWLGRLFLGGIYLYNLNETGIKTQKNGVQLIISEHLSQPFSFFKAIYVPEKIMNDEFLQKIVMIHEKAHIRAWHSADVLFVEAVNVFFWFSPLIWLIKREIKDVHEFEADAAVLRHVNPMTYGESLLSWCESSPKSKILSSNFFGSRLKRRFIRMAQRGRTTPSLAQHLLMLPILMLLILSLAFVRPDNGKVHDHVEKIVTFKSIANVATLDPPLKETTLEWPMIKNNNIYYNDSMPIFTQVDQMPHFGQNSEDLLAYLSKHISYPELAREKGIEGTVVLQFIIDENGEVSDPKVLKSIGGGCDEESIKAISQMPPWQPGKHQGKPVKVKYTLPIKFMVLN